MAATPVAFALLYIQGSSNEAKGSPAHPPTLADLLAHAEDLERAAAQHEAQAMHALAQAEDLERAAAQLEAQAMHTRNFGAVRHPLEQAQAHGYHHQSALMSPWHQPADMYAMPQMAGAVPGWTTVRQLPVMRVAGAPNAAPAHFANPVVTPSPVQTSMVDQPNGLSPGMYDSDAVAAAYARGAAAGAVAAGAYARGFAAGCCSGRKLLQEAQLVRPAEGVTDSEFEAVTDSEFEAVTQRNVCIREASPSHPAGGAWADEVCNGFASHAVCTNGSFLYNFDVKVKDGKTKVSSCGAAGWQDMLWGKGRIDPWSEEVVEWRKHLDLEATPERSKHACRYKLMVSFLQHVFDTCSLQYKIRDHSDDTRFYIVTFQTVVPTGHIASMASVAQNFEEACETFKNECQKILPGGNSIPLKLLHESIVPASTALSSSPESCSCPRHAQSSARHYCLRASGKAEGVTDSEFEAVTDSEFEAVTQRNLTSFRTPSPKKH